MKLFVFEERNDIYGEVTRTYPSHGDWFLGLGHDFGPFTEDRLLNLNVSPTVKNRIRGMKEGTGLKLASLCSESDLYLRRLTADEVDRSNRAADLKRQLNEVQDQIKALIPEELLNRRKALSREIKKLGL